MVKLKIGAYIPQLFDTMDGFVIYFPEKDDYKISRSGNILHERGELLDVLSLIVFGKEPFVVFRCYGFREVDCTHPIATKEELVSLFTEVDYKSNSGL